MAGPLFCVFGAEIPRFGVVVFGQRRRPANGRVSERTEQASACVQNNEQRSMKIRITQDHPRHARLTKGIIVDAEPVTCPPELMRVKDFGAFENGALVQGWELILPPEEVEALLKKG